MEEGISDVSLLIQYFFIVLQKQIWHDKYMMLDLFAAEKEMWELQCKFKGSSIEKVTSVSGKSHKYKQDYFGKYP